jgi:hypothetical protein
MACGAGATDGVRRGRHRLWHGRNTRRVTTSQVRDVPRARGGAKLAPRARMKPLRLALLALLGACGTMIEQTPINPPPIPMAPRAASAVELFTSGAPARAHVDVALLLARPASAFSDGTEADVIAELRQRAADLGCDGLVVTAIQDSARFKMPHAEVTATCIVYTPVATATVD